LHVIAFENVDLVSYDESDLICVVWMIVLSLSVLVDFVLIEGIRF